MVDISSLIPASTQPFIQTVTVYRVGMQQLRRFVQPIVSCKRLAASLTPAYLIGQDAILTSTVCRQSINLQQR